MNTRIATSLAALALAASAVAVSAQTTVAPNPDPAKVGVTQPTAMDAESKAVPRSDTGTLVRTDRRRHTTGTTSTDGSTTSSSMSGATGDSSMGTANASTESTIDNARPTAAGHRARHARN